MFFRRRRSSFFVRILLLVLGVKWLSYQKHNKEERAAYRSRARAFRHKLCEAAAVWNDDTTEEPVSSDTHADPID